MIVGNLRKPAGQVVKASSGDTAGKAIALCGLLILVMYPEIASAAPWDGGLQKAVDLLTGRTPRLLAILAFCVLGYMSMTGRMSWALGGSIMGGIVLIFGSAWFADTFIGAVSTG